MVQGGETGAERSDGVTSFACALEELKERGSALLVVGSVPEEVYARMSAKMLGDGDASPRRRLLVTPVSGVSHRDFRLEGVSRRTPEWTRIVQYESHARHAAAADADAAVVSSPDGPVEIGAANGHGDDRTAADGRDPLAEIVDGEIIDLGLAVAETIDQFDGIASGLSPAELRVAFDCLPTLLSEYDRETVFRFVHVLGNNVRSVGGMAHFWLPQGRRSETVRLFEPLFDATVELRLDGHELAQRWHFRDADISSEWLSFD
ncbi:DUF7504 family protein [Halopelagius longus]|uniref:Uncharacterized protein n=1 Tax=Halopelagius longus TaxID=1236180 RepID=A0A1H1B9V0_9EURY|nr:hypothetical protein [Halopelagius longus]RDI70700.1 hypothetical protein DWB78_02580 [Halopelagius longus]SDQ48672.1 hypothetical protein SAMN05216278_1702 [Halopelagius longus]